MLDRYTLKPMKELWHPETKFQFWHNTECSWMKARADFGELPQEASDAAEAVKVDSHTLARIKTLEEEYDHDMIAFVVAMQEQMGEWASEYHKRITSYDIEDPALIMLLRSATMLIISEAAGLENALREKAQEHKWTLMIGRTHGQYAEPTTFGHLLIVYAEAIRRSIERLEFVLDHELNEGKMSGPVGVYGEIGPAMEEKALSYMGLTPAKAETQILQRDRHAAVLSALAILAGTIEQMARTFWEMMRSDVGELREPRKPSQRGSSSMAWKRNPILMERLEGLPRLIRGFLSAQMESIATPEGRDISQSIVERHTFPDATSLVHYAVVRMAKCVENMEVFPDKMRRNLDKTQGVWAGQRVQTALMDAGVPYNTAYEHIQRAGFMASDEEI
ncbi:MAG: adenylosuccinate lyase, partial [Candidatus Spechtbacteria bacterium]|nr:adenylosuccinate lyase [Candidatus Spechtbacteria bacterium]